MGYAQLDHTKCPNGHLTPVQPSEAGSVEAYRMSIETGTAPLFVACRECDCVYKVESLHSSPPSYELQPFDKGAALRRFEVFIPCDRQDCARRAIVVAVRNSDITAEALIKEITDKKLDAVECPAGHAFPYPPWR